MTIKKGRNLANLKVTIVNCRSIKGKADLITTFIEIEQPDILIGTESWLDENILTPEIFPDHLQVFRRDRNVHGGGVFIAINKTIPCFERTDLTVENTEIQWCQASLPNQDVLIGSFYRPPETNHTPILNLGESLHKITSTTKSPCIILGGDFNVPNLDWANSENIVPSGSLQNSLFSDLQ